MDWQVLGRTGMRCLAVWLALTVFFEAVRAQLAPADANAAVLARLRASAHPHPELLVDRAGLDALAAASKSDAALSKARELLRM